MKSLIQSIKQIFKSETVLVANFAAADVSEEMMVAVGVVLLETAGKDNDYAPEETGSIIRHMAGEFGLEHAAVVELLKAGDEIRRNPSSLDEIFRTLNEEFTNEQRIKILSMCWQVIEADGKVEKSEERYSVQLQNRLRLTEEERKQAIAMCRQARTQ